MTVQCYLVVIYARKGIIKFPTTDSDPACCNQHDNLGQAETHDYGWTRRSASRLLWFLTRRWANQRRVRLDQLLSEGPSTVRHKRWDEACNILPVRRRKCAQKQREVFLPASATGP